MEEERRNEEPKNCCRVELKKSSSTGKVGYDILCQISNSTQEEMDKMMEIALKTAFKAQQVIMERGL